ncbi:hypothetical protein [Paenibacillus agricola]|uniref:Uncharacterized protein n=1 Tax=Paenibacillus agricola TaxID=2716264 RepID=A0ABX0JHN3_9BACL|nr:hypothetical protein [Paenibacillus agricola]NHN34819.1 hypothetical protein [Paenibacillus agricola]
MLYQVINLLSHELNTLKPSDILDMDYDSDNRIIVTGNNQEKYFLLATEDIVNKH